MGSAARWLIFRPNSSKGAGKKKVGRKNFMAEFWSNLGKSGRNGAGLFYSESFIAEMRKNTNPKKDCTFVLLYEAIDKKNYQFGSYSKQAACEKLPIRQLQ